MQNKKMIYKTLSYLGTLPFFLSLILHMLEYEIAISLIKSYSLVIFVFILGTYWGFALHDNKTDAKLMIASNVLAILIWISYFTKVYFTFATIGFISIILCDYYFLRKKILGQEYFATRTIVTIIILPVILYFGYYEASLV